MDIIRMNMEMERYPDVKRTIEMRSDQTFETLHHAILRSVGYDTTQLASFYVCNDEWQKKVEITLIDMAADEGDMVPVMSDTPLGAYIEEKGQKVVYEYDFVMMHRFFIEVEKIEEDAKTQKAYPAIIASEGEAPPQYDEELASEDLTDEDEAIISDLRRKNEDLLLNADDEEDSWDKEPDIFDDFDDFDSHSGSSSGRRSDDDDY